jgi:rhodanese-related sulfurtransferase
MPKPKNEQKRKQQFPAWIWAIVAVAVIALIIMVVSQLKPVAQAGYPDELTVAQAAEKREQGAFILDVREPQEWQQAHIPGATLIPLSELSSRMNEVPKDREVVVVCRSGNRSATGRDILRSAGYTRVTSMAGGVTQWQAQGLPVASGQ